MHSHAVAFQLANLSGCCGRQPWSLHRPGGPRLQVSGTRTWLEEYPRILGSSRATIWTSPAEPTIPPMTAHRSADAPRLRGNDNSTSVESAPGIQIDVRRSRRLRHAPNLRPSQPSTDKVQGSWRGPKSLVDRRRHDVADGAKQGSFAVGTRLGEFNHQLFIFPNQYWTTGIARTVGSQHP